MNLYESLAIIATVFGVYGIVGHVCELSAAKSYHRMVTKINEIRAANPPEFVFEPEDYSGPVN